MRKNFDRMSQVDTKCPDDVAILTITNNDNLAGMKICRPSMI